jgi:glutamate dehydrogenase
MGADGMVADEAARQRLLDSLAHALCDGALPGELEEFGPAEQRTAAEFIAACASRRPPGVALVRIESFGTQLGRRRMRICIANDDMPFLVDSVGAAIAARGLIIHRLLHPVVCVRRDESGCLTAVEPL